MIEVDGFPPGGFKRRSHVQLASGRSCSPVPFVSVTDLEVESVRILHVEAIEFFFRVMVGNRVEPAFLEFCLDRLEVKWLDSETEAVPDGTRAATIAASSATASAAASGSSCRSIA